MGIIIYTSGKNFKKKEKKLAILNLPIFQTNVSNVRSE